MSADAAAAPAAPGATGPAAAPPVDVETAEHVPARRACVFVLGGAPFAVDVREAREVVVLDACARVPGAPSALVGVMNLRGGILPVVDARPLLGLEPRPVGPGTRALVFADGDVRAAVAIERVLGLDAFDEPEPWPDGQAAPPFAAGRLPRQDGAATLLDAPRMLAALRSAWSSNPSPTRGRA